MSVWFCLLTSRKWKITSKSLVVSVGRTFKKIEVSSGLVAGGSSTGGTVDVNQEEIQWTKKNCVDLPRLSSPHGNRASFGVGGGLLPPRFIHEKHTITTEQK